MFRTPVKMVAAALAAGAVLTACGGPVKLGAAAVMTSDRISASTLSAHVANLNKYYLKYKDSVQLQYEVSQMPQEVLSWLIRFQVGDEMAARNGISVTPGQQQAELQAINKQCSVVDDHRRPGAADRTGGGQRPAAGPAR